MKKLLAALLVAMVSVASDACFSAEPRPTIPANDIIEVVAPGAAPMVVSHAALTGLPRTQITASIHQEAPSQWDGVLLADVLHLVHAPQAGELRGREMTKIVRITAADGYQVVFSLAELDADFSHTTVLLADRHEGRPLTVEDGPYRLVVPGDKRAGRWVRNIKSIELIDVGSR